MVPARLATTTPTQAIRTSIHWLACLHHHRLPLTSCPRSAHKGRQPASRLLPDLRRRLLVVHAKVGQVFKLVREQATALLGQPLCDLDGVIGVGKGHGPDEVDLGEQGSDGGIHRIEVRIHRIEVEIHRFEVELHRFEVELHRIEVELHGKEVEFSYNRNICS